MVRPLVAAKPDHRRAAAGEGASMRVAEQSREHADIGEHGGSARGGRRCWCRAARTLGAEGVQALQARCGVGLSLVDGRSTSDFTAVPTLGCLPRRKASRRPFRR